MFAILLTDKMDVFYKNILSFPTIVFSILLLICILFWLVAILGFLDISFMDPDVDVGDVGDIGDVGDVGGDAGPSAVAGIIQRFGLNGVPLTIIITSISLIGWLISFYTVHILFPLIPSGLLTWVAGVGTLLGATIGATFITAMLIKPLRPLFKKLEVHLDKRIVGQTAKVRSSRVDQAFGEAVLEDGGAGLILKVRSADHQVYGRGDDVVIIDYVEADNTFKVVSLEEFQSMRSSI